MSYHLNERMRKNTVETNRSISNHFEIFHVFFGLAKKNGLRLFRVCFEYPVLRIFIFLSHVWATCFFRGVFEILHKIIVQMVAQNPSRGKIVPQSISKMKKTQLPFHCRVQMAGGKCWEELSLRGIKFFSFPTQFESNTLETPSRVIEASLSGLRWFWVFSSFLMMLLRKKWIEIIWVCLSVFEIFHFFLQYEMWVHWTTPDMHLRMGKGSPDIHQRHPKMFLIHHWCYPELNKKLLERTLLAHVFCWWNPVAWSILFIDGSKPFFGQLLPPIFFG